MYIIATLRDKNELLREKIVIFKQKLKQHTIKVIDKHHDSVGR